MPSCNFLAACVPRLLSHYRTTRRYDSDFHLPCMYLNCDRIFNSESNLKKHYDKDHKVVERTTIVDPFNLLEVDDNQTDNFDQTRTGIPPDGDTQPYNKPLSSTDAPSTLYGIHIIYPSNVILKRISFCYLLQTEGNLSTAAVRRKETEPV